MLDNGPDPKVFTELITPDGFAYTPSRDLGDQRETNLLRDVAFNRHSMNDGHHVSPYDNGKIQIGTDGIVVKLTQGINEDAFKRTLSQATRATIGLDLNAPQAGDWEPCDNAHQHLSTNAPGATIRDARPLPCGHLMHEWDYKKRGWKGKVGYGADWEEMLKGGLQTALESQVIVFQVQGVDRTCTHQIVRTRNAAYHQQSQRASYYGDQPEARMPESVWRNPRARAAWLEAKAASDRAYRVACEEDISYQDARHVLLEATNNYIMCEYSLREFINVFAYRGCSMFSWQIVYVMREMRKLLLEAHPWLEPYIKISCEKTGTLCPVCQGSGYEDSGYGTKEPCEACTGSSYYNRKCTFQGWESVEGQCDFPWAKQKNRVFLSNAHGIQRRPGMAPYRPRATPNAISQGPELYPPGFVPGCRDCNMDAHRCKGCGAAVLHGVYSCFKCETGD